MLPLLVDVRGMAFSCPFPTAGAIRRASANPSSTLQTLVVHDSCSSDYGGFLLAYCLPILGAFVGLAGAWQLILRSQGPGSFLMRFLTQKGDAISLISHKRIKFTQLLLFALMIYDHINDIAVYKNILKVVDYNSIQDPCVASNERGLFYVHLPNTYTNFGDGTTYPDFVDEVESGFTTFSQYLSYIDEWVEYGAITERSRNENVDAFATFCSEFYVVEGDRGLIRVCSYSDATKGSERCEMVRDVQEEKNQRFKKFVVASIAVVCVKEFLKLLLVLFVWLRAASRELHPVELAFVGESPLLLLLLWRRPSFLYELLLGRRTWKSYLLVFFVEDLLESANQIALVAYFALMVGKQGIAYSIMFSLFVSALKLMKTGNNVFTELQRERVDDATVHVEEDEEEEEEEDGQHAVSSRYELVILSRRLAPRVARVTPVTHVSPVMSDEGRGCDGDGTNDHTTGKKTIVWKDTIEQVGPGGHANLGNADSPGENTS